ncbi:MAG: bifunctional metallophosphatase/5'-nucleotidase [Oscillibacter sp.]|nr:bifunctional metallophosphatase/5'-nucleotidase [Oscillibacter sp.]
MTLERTARRLAAPALTIAALWLCGVCASADVDAGGGPVIREPFPAAVALANRPLDNDDDVINQTFGADAALTNRLFGDGGAEQEAREGSYRGKTVILHSNDTIGAAEGFPRMAWLRREFERLGAETILVDAGNFSIGSMYTSSGGAAAVELMNLTGYDAAALGRYEFTYGYDEMRRNLRRADFPVLCANAVEDGETICAPNYSYTTKSGVTVGFFGLLTPRAGGNVDPTQTHNVEIYKRQDIFNCVQEQIDALRRDGSVIPGADVVIALSDIGSESSSAASGYSSLEIFSEAEGLDMILDGMSQSVMTAGPNGEQVQSCGGSFAYIGAVVIDDATKSIEDHYLIPTENLPSDETVLEALENLQNRYKMDYGAVFARTETNLNGESVPGNRTEETNLGDLISDAMVWTASQEIKNPPVDEEHMIGLTNGGAVRASIPEGNITRNHVVAAFPFANTVSVVYLKGAELLEVLEAATAKLPEKENSYPQSSGIVLTIDERVPYDAGELYPDSAFARPASIRRVRVESVHGKPFDPDALYGVATNNYCAGGGDAFYLLGTAAERYDSMTSIEQSVSDYIKLKLGGVVTEAMYGKPRGDHTILKDG